MASLRPYLCRILTVLGVLALGSAAACGEREASLIVSGAASLGDVLAEAGEAFTGETGIEVTFNLGGSTFLARQIELGAPVDAAIFAGAGPMDRLAARNLVVVGSRVDVLVNRLVIIARVGEGLSVDSLENLAAAYSGRIAIADPAFAPAGRYARAALESLGLWDRLGDRIVPSLDVRAAAAMVAAGNAEFGIVYATDAQAIAGVDAVLDVPPALHPPIVYPAGVISATAHPDEARRFLGFLSSEQAARIFERHGFEPAQIIR